MSTTTALNQSTTPPAVIEPVDPHCWIPGVMAPREPVAGARARFYRRGRSVIQSGKARACSDGRSRSLSA
jgi:hypothetical protein